MREKRDSPEGEDPDRIHLVTLKGNVADEVKELKNS